MKISSLIGHVNELSSVIFTWEKPADRSISEFYKTRKYLGSRDRRFISETVYGLIRNYKLLKSVRSQIAEIPSLASSDTLILIYYIIFKKDDEEINNYFRDTVSDYEEIKSQVLSKAELLSGNHNLKYSFPEWMLNKLSGLIELKETEKFLASLNEPAPTSIRLVIPEKEDELRLVFKEMGIELSKSNFAPMAYRLNKRLNFNDMELFSSGCFEPQDEGSQLVTLFSGAKGELMVLDACAGGGGKSMQIATLLSGDSVVFAFDADQRRLEQFRKRLKGKGYKNIIILDDEKRLVPLTEGFDLVLIDAPCSGSGTIRRNPDLKWRLNEKDIDEYSDKQYAILLEYSKYVKKDGVIAYITCSFFPEENEHVVSRFLTSFPNFSLIKENEFFTDFKIENRNGFLRLFPHLHETDGFTACLLKKNF